MFYEEKIINDVLCCRYLPNGEWNPFSDIELTRMVVKLKEKVKKLECQIEFKMYY